MANKLYEEADLQAIANAIRAKGQMGTFKVAQMAGKIAKMQIGVEPTNLTYSQENSAVADYIADVDYSNDPSYARSDMYSYTSRQTDYRKDQPFGKPIQLENGTLVVTDENANKSVSKAVSAGVNTVYNVTPNGNGGTYCVYNGSVKNVGKLLPSGKLRMIFAPSVTNVRDIGGWNCDGGTVKYGKIFRGGQLRDSGGVTISQDDVKLFRDLLGIKSEVNFQVQSEGGGTNPTPLGNDIICYPLPIAYKVATMNYDSIVDMDDDLHDTFKTALEQLLYNGIHNIPTYFHCTHGADRTGVTAWFLEHLLGVSNSDCDKDYELTSCDTSSGNRWRNQARYTSLINYMKTCSNGSMRDCVVAWCVKNGIPIADINAFRTAMIDGAPAALTANINNNCNSIAVSSDINALEVGRSVIVTAKLLPSWATNSITWSADSGAVRVSGNGKTATITAVSAGNAHITATCNGHTSTIAVTVTGSNSSYTNQIPVSTNASGNIYNGIGYKDGVYLSSSDGITEESNANTFTTGYIPAKNGDVLRCTFNGVVTGGAKVRIVSYDSAKNKLSYKVLTTEGNWTSVEAGKGTLNITGTNFPASTAFIRICLPISGAASIVTINEEIT